MNLLASLFAAVVLAQSTMAPSPGDAAFSRGDFGAAHVAYAAAAAAHPDDLDAIIGLGTVDLYRNDLADARGLLERAAKLDPANPRLRSRLRALEEREPHAGDFQIAMRDDRVSIPFASSEPLPMIHVRINGVEGSFFLDTGATTIDLTPAAAARFHVAAHVVGQGVFAGGKTATISAGRIDRMDVDGLSVRGIDAGILPATLPGGNQPADGGIGTTFLRHFLSTIDYKHARLVLYPRSSSAAFEREAAKAGATIVPMWRVGDHFIFARGHVDDGPDSLFNIDTGGEQLGVQLTKEGLAAAGIPEPDPSKAHHFMGGGGAASALPFTAASVTVGSTTRMNLPGLYFDKGDQFAIFPFAVAGTISDEFFRPGAVTFDFDAMKMIVT